MGSLKCDVLCEWRLSRDSGGYEEKEAESFNSFASLCPPGLAEKLVVRRGKPGFFGAVLLSARIGLDAGAGDVFVFDLCGLLDGVAG
jgi:hypothetical protein